MPHKFKVGDRVRYNFPDDPDSCFNGKIGVVTSIDPVVPADGIEWRSDQMIHAPWRVSRDWACDAEDLTYLGPAPRWSTNKLGDFPKKRGGARGKVQSR